MRRKQRFGRNTPLTVKLPRHAHGQGTFAGQDIRRALPRAKHAAEIGLGQAAGVHAIQDGLYRVRRIDRPMPPFVILDDKSQQVEAIGLGCSLLRLIVETAFDLVERVLVVGLAAERADGWFLRHETVSGSMRSYSAWVPMNFTNTRPKV